VRAVCGRRPGDAETEVKMTLTLDNNEVLTGRFAPCTSSLRLLITLPEVARRARAGGVFVSPAGLQFCNACSPLPMNEMNLTRREICRGKILLRKKSTNLKERTQTAPNQ
jgi:hypothetical protein